MESTLLESYVVLCSPNIDVELLMLTDIWNADIGWPHVYSFRRTKYSPVEPFGASLCEYQSIVLTD